jgi:glycosyltransferase involved in cell wall biosynthesis
MFGAQSLKEERKGGYLLLQALQRLPKSLRDEAVLITLGGDSEKFSSITGMHTIDLGYIGGDQMKAIAYSAADLFLFPTRAEAFGLVAQEALSCGTPIVSFNVGGVPDTVRHRITGYLAAQDDVRDFSSGIEELLEDRALLQQLGETCRQVAVNEFSPDLQAKRYIALYEKVLRNGTELQG